MVVTPNIDFVLIYYRSLNVVVFFSFKQEDKISLFLKSSFFAYAESFGTGLNDTALVFLVHVLQINPAYLTVNPTEAPRVIKMLVML